MALDPRIILGGQTVDYANALGSAAQTAGQINAVRQQNALADVYRQNGPGIMAGDQNALNALAQIDPGAALGVQGDRLGMDATRLNMDATRQNMAFDQEKMTMLYAEGQREAEEARRKMSAEQAAQTAQQLEGIVAGAAQLYDRGDRAGFETFLTQSGIDPAQYPFDQFPAHAAKVLGTADALKLGRQETMNPNDRFKVVGSQLVDLGAEGGPQAVLTSPGQTETIFGPDGKPIVQRGPADAKPFTEGQSKDVTYATRARGALDAFDPVADELSSRVNTVLDAAPLGLGREMQGGDYQVARNAGDEFLQAILRKDTGAAITEQEQALYGKTYLPQPGDGPDVLSAKKEARARALAALEAGMSGAQIEAQTRALSSGLAPPAPQGGDMSDDDLLRMYGGE
jgi:hypothetical protein